ncbi:MAG TPA: hypothetical protein VFK88_08950 [Gallionella sp.]|nr:hypothetical protein [Gallionella sp.]
MDKLRKALGWLYFSIGLMLLLFVVLSWKDTPSSNMAAAQTVFRPVLIGGLVYGAAGLSLLRNFKYSVWICLPLAVLSLFYFPFGTITGACYLWYYWKFVYRRTEST